MLDSELEERLEVNTSYYKYTMGTLVHLEVSFETLKLSTTFTTVPFKIYILTITHLLKGRLDHTLGAHLETTVFASFHWDDGVKALLLKSVFIVLGILLCFFLRRF